MRPPPRAAPGEPPALRPPSREPRAAVRARADPRSPFPARRPPALRGAHLMAAAAAEPGGKDCARGRAHRRGERNVPLRYHPAPAPPRPAAVLQPHGGSKRGQRNAEIRSRVGRGKERRGPTRGVGEADARQSAPPSARSGTVRAAHAR